MSNGSETFTVFKGPNLVAPFAAVIAEFDDPFPGVLPSAAVRRLLSELIPASSPLDLGLTGDRTDFVTLAAAFMSGWQEQIWCQAAPFLVARLGGGRARIACGFFDPEATRKLLQAGINIAKAIFLRATGTDRTGPDITAIRRTISAIRVRPLSRTTAALTCLAGKRGIPSYSVCNSALRLFGQGSKGVYFCNLANQEDSYTGWMISSNKALTAQFLRQLGFPAAEHGIANDAAAARRIAGRMGFPLVVKPPDRGMGTSVAVGITTDEELIEAFERARASSHSGQVLVERLVLGDDHRLSVFNGKLIRVNRLLPPRIVGDGKLSVAELIAEDNRNRAASAAANSFFSGHTTDSEMKALLRKQGVALEDCPAQGSKLLLRRISNLHTGGTSEDVTARIHPNNIAMAEAIARTLHLDAVGIDFITPDIGKAWNETPCAIIEINCNPGVRDETTLEKMLLERFPAGSDGRIPSILILGGGAEVTDKVMEHVQSAGRRVGYTSGSLTLLAGQPRFAGAADLPARIQSLLLDSTCDVLVVSCTSADIAAHGLPHTRYDLILIAAKEQLSEDMFRLIENNSSQVIGQVTAKTMHEAALPLVAKVVNGG